MADFYVRPDTSHSITRNGLTYATAWGGWSEVLWNGAAGVEVNGGDTLFMCGTHTFTTLMSVSFTDASLGNETIISGGYNLDPGTITFADTGDYINHSRGHFHFKDLTINGGGTSSCIFISNANNNKFDNIIFSGGGKGISLNAVDGQVHDTFIVTNCTFGSSSTEEAISCLLDAGTAAITVSNVLIDNNTFNAATVTMRTQEASGVGSLFHDFTLTNNTFNACGDGVTAVRIIDRPAITGSKSADWYNITVDDNILTNSGTLASGAGAINIGPFITSGSVKNSVSRNTITNTYGDNGPMDLHGMQNTIVEDNIITNVYAMQTTGIDANGILCDPACIDVVITGNHVSNVLGLPSSTNTHNSGAGIMLLADCVNVYAYGNIFSNCKHGIYLGENTQIANICNNVFIDCVDNGVLISNTNTNPSVTNIKNNVFTQLSTSSAKFVYNRTVMDTLAEDYNIQYGFTDTLTGHTIGTNTSSVDPLLNSDYTPDPSSPAYHAGIPIRFNMKDFKGHKFNIPPTIGAYEFTSRSPAQSRRSR